MSRRQAKRRRQLDDSEEHRGLNTTSSWGDILQSDVGYLILDKLPEAVERIRFSAVCKRWNSISKEYQHQEKSCHNVLPMLLVPSPNAPAKREPPRIYALSSLGKYYSNLQLPLLFSRARYYGSSYGWIVTHNRNYTVELIYPFGREVRKIDLPALRVGIASECLELYKLVVSPDSTPDDHVVVAIYGGMNELATIKSGEKSWVFINPQHGTIIPASLFSDIIFYQGAVYAASKYSEIVKIDVQARPPILKVIVPVNRKIQFRKTYLVESTSSDLYFLQRCYVPWDSTPCEGLTVKFNIFKLTLHEGKRELEDLKSINGDTFFVGDNSSIAIRANGCAANSIYFIDDLNDPGYNKKIGPVDIGYYNVEDGSIGGHFYETNPAHHKNVARPIWIMPLLNNSF